MDVSDRNAHAWVEVWFRGYGWLPFDPTPSRGNLGGPYTSSSLSFEAGGARAVLAASGLGGAAARELLRFELGADGKPGRGDPGVQFNGIGSSAKSGAGRGRIGLGAVAFLLVLLLALLVAATKVVLRRPLPDRRPATPRGGLPGGTSSGSSSTRGSSCRKPPRSRNCRGSSAINTGVDPRVFVDRSESPETRPVPAAPGAAAPGRRELAASRRFGSGRPRRRGPGMFSLRTLLRTPSGLAGNDARFLGRDTEQGAALGRRQGRSALTRASVGSCPRVARPVSRRTLTVDH